MSIKIQNSTIHVSLTPVLNNFVDELVASGLYSNISEVIREALREKLQKQIAESQKLQKLRDAVEIGIKQIQNNEFVDDDLKSILHRIKK